MLSKLGDAMNIPELGEMINQEQIMQMKHAQQQQQPPAGIRAGGWGTVNRTSSISDLMGMASSVGGPSMNLQQMMMKGYFIN